MSLFEVVYKTNFVWFNAMASKETQPSVSEFDPETLSLATMSKSQEATTSSDNGKPLNPDLPDAQPHDDPQVRQVRQRILTEKGLEYQQQVHQRALRTAIKAWQRKVDLADDVLADCDDVKHLSSFRDELLSLLNKVQNAAKQLSEFAEVSEPIQRLEDETRHCRKAINDQIKNLKDVARSTSSKRTKSSTVSRATSRSSKALKLETAARAAELEVQLRLHEAEQQQKAALLQQEAQLARLQIEKNLEIERAKLRAI